MTNKKELYGENFQKNRAEYSYQSAKKVIEIFTKYYQPESVVDIGCGSGTWLKAWKEADVKDIKGLDISDLEQSLLYVDKKDIISTNLETYRNTSNKKYDLAMSLEVAEHISEENAENFIDNIVSHSDVVLFSAALPEQVGTGHINCQYPKYWIDIFKEKGYVCFDLLRKELMDYDKIVNCCYIQNIYVFIKKEKQDIFINQGFRLTENPIVFYHWKYVEPIINKKNSTKKKFYLFNVIPIYKIKMTNKYKKHYLFGVLPVLKIKI